MIKVVHKNKASSEAIYVGRGSVLGNVFDFTGSTHPQVKMQVSNRTEAIKRYREYLENKIEEKDREICMALNIIYKKAKKGDIELSCYCAPQACHGDVVAEIIESKL